LTVDIIASSVSKALLVGSDEFVCAVLCCVVYLWTLDGSHRPAHAQTHTRLSVHIAARRRTRSKGVPLFVLSATVVECRTHRHRRACSTECSPSSDPRPRHLWWFHGHTTQPRWCKTFRRNSKLNAVVSTSGPTHKSACSTLLAKCAAAPSGLASQQPAVLLSVPIELAVNVQ
jgi:hypothetical protein